MKVFDPPWKLIPSVFDCFRRLQGGPQEFRIDSNSILVGVKHKKSENVDFVNPSHVKSLLLGPNGDQDGAQMESGINFYSD